MTVKVVDASAFAAVSFQEPSAPDVFKRLDGHDLCAPALLRFEMINVCRKKIRDHPEQRDILIKRHRESIGVIVDEYEVDAAEVLELADRLGLSGYDASYLWLARSLGAELVTLDDRLAKAAAKP